MALIGKIREKSGWAVGFIALGLGLFIVGSDLVSRNSFLLGNNASTAGEIAGHPIDIKEYNAKIEELKNAYFLNSGKAPGEQEMQGIKEQAWNQLIFETANQKEFDEAGLTVSDEELTDMVQGKNIHPGIRQAFTDPKTGVFDKNLVINYLRNIEKMEPRQQAMWFNFEKSLGPDRLRSKYDNLFKMSVYVTKAEARREYISQNEKINVKYLYIPFYSIPDSTIKVTDDELNDYVSRNKEKYKSDASANIQYVTFPVYPSHEDTVYFREDIQSTLRSFAETDSDSSFVRANSDNPTDPVLVTIGELPKQLTGLPGGIKKDSVYGPFYEGNLVKLYKISDIVNDSNYSARASHILFKWTSESPADKAEALKRTKEVLARIKKGENFELLAGMFGTDGTASQGGDLGWFSKGRMVKPFEDAVFNFKGVGVLPEPVETQFGYHIIKVTEPKTNKKFKLATVERSVAAGDLTRDSIYKKAEIFASTAKDLAGFETTAGQSKYFTFTAPNVTPNSPYINTLSNPRELVRWIFSDDNKGQEVSPVFEVENQFVVAVVKNKYPKGKVNLDNLRNELTTKVRNEKKAEQIISKLGPISTSLEDAAKKYGTEAQLNTADAVTLASNVIGSIGFDPLSTGKAFGLKSKGKKIGPFAGENGVVALELTGKTPAPEIADFTQYKTQLTERVKSRVDYSLTEAIKDAAKIEDNRYKFF